jgi:hypothetical protein
MQICRTSSHRVLRRKHCAFSCQLVTLHFAYEQLQHNVTLLVVHSLISVPLDVRMMSGPVEQPSVEEATEPKPELPLLSMDILQTIRTAQAQHGLRHGDYGRYRYAAPIAKH